MEDRSAHAPSTRRDFDFDLANASVLVVDDEPGMQNFVRKSLLELCHRVDATSDTNAAAHLLDQHHYDVIVLDNIMPQKTGVAWLSEQKRVGLFSDVVLMTAYADLETAIAALRAGASDFLIKPFRGSQLLNAVSKCLSRTQLRRRNSVLSHELEAGRDLLRHRDALLGKSAQIQAVRDAIGKAARTLSHVVIRGEVGSGKQVAARMLHAHSARAGKPFVWLQCHGVTEQGFAARLFGSLGDSTDNQTGMLFYASGGTLYLEDVEMLSAQCQNILVELLTTGRFRPVGAERSLTLDVRMVCCSNRALSEAVKEGRFRPDLFYLLNVVEIVLPPLKERGEDVIELAGFLSEKLAKRMGLEPPELTPAIRRRLLAHDWPGNVMELRNAIERALIQSDFNTLPGGPQIDLETESLATVEKRHILAVLDTCGGNRAKAARRLGVARKTIDRKCQVWGL